MNPRKNSFRKKAGQSLIEFALLSLVFFSFFFMMIRLCMNFALGHYIHYATFMSARAYFAGARDNTQQRTSAIRTLESYVGDSGTRYGIVPGEGGGGGGPEGSTIGPGPGYQKNSEYWVWIDGVSFRFRQKLYLMPLVGTIAKRRGRGDVEFVSESYLGREVTYKECIEYMSGANPSGKKWLIDNGC